ncbi:MAG: hypothetical protein IJV64_04670 [Oscillospiraceae bacterium]|nr:hypothetical protein [Oscillospiraceae bacterium]
MNFDISRLEKQLWQAKPEKTLPDNQVNPYLLNVLLKRLEAGDAVTYGEVDFSQFEADDLRVLSGYIRERNNMSNHLANLIAGIDKAEAFCRKARAFC